MRTTRPSADPSTAIPFGDINDFSHHTTSYFPAKLIGRVDVDRGPGTASTIGEATFGGTIAMYSKDPRTDLAVIPTYSRGSWNTQVTHIGVKTGNGFLRSVKIRLQVGNVFNQKVQVLESIDSSAANAYARDTFNVLPTRNYFLTVSGEF